MPKSSRAILLQARMSVSWLRRARKKGRPPELPAKHAKCEKKQGEGCPRNTRKDAKKKDEKFERDRRAMLSSSGDLSEPFMLRLLEGRCWQRPSIVASDPSLPIIPFPSSFRVFSRVSRAI